jgi:hypothetical protein
MGSEALVVTDCRSRSNRSSPLILVRHVSARVAGRIHRSMAGEARCRANNLRHGSYWPFAPKQSPNGNGPQCSYGRRQGIRGPPTCSRAGGAGFAVTNSPAGQLSLRSTGLEGTTHPYEHHTPSRCRTFPEIRIGQRQDVQEMGCSPTARAGGAPARLAPDSAGAGRVPTTGDMQGTALLLGCGR